MRSFSRSHRALAGAASVMLLVLLAGCAGGGTPYQAQGSDTLSPGYTDQKIDASHYAVIYTDYDKDRAQDYLHYRAAQVAQTAGFAYFAFDTEGVAVRRKTETHFDLDQLNNAAGKGNGSAVPLNNYIPPTNATNATLYYSAAGKISLLTPQQAQGNPKAIEVAPVLAKMSAKP